MNVLLMLLEEPWECWQGMKKKEPKFYEPKLNIKINTCMKIKYICAEERNAYGFGYT